MTINQLMGILDDLRDELGGNTMVKLMTQPHYPMKNTIAGVVSSRQIDNYRNDSDNESEDKDPVVYILANDNNGYGTKTAWEVADLL